MTTNRIIVGAALLATLAACGGGDPTVRDGAQAVHPSPSALASGTSDPVELGMQTAPYHACGQHHHCHPHKAAYGANDGSTPIID